VRLAPKENFENCFVIEWGEAADRIFAGIDLFKLNKAPVLVLTGGKLPWSIGVPEGEYLRDVAIDLGVPKKDILLTENVENTDQEQHLSNTHPLAHQLTREVFHQ
jgi:uncharacterized SAM-binding protein YcdF (DUF218 family)